MGWLVGPLAATGALVLVEFVSVGFYASVGGLLIAGTLAFRGRNARRRPFHCAERLTFFQPFALSFTVMSRTVGANPCIEHGSLRNLTHRSAA
jgi:hypothetical protein